MPNWSNTVPDDPRGQGLPLVRTPAGRSLLAIVTSADLIGCDTHFWGGHTVPCTKPECDACAAGISYTWHAYLTAFNAHDNLHFIFEMTAQAAKHFAAYRQEHATLRGCQFEAWRWKQRRNGRVMLKMVPSAMPSAALPNAPDLTRVMSIIWRLPVPNVETHGHKRGCQHAFVDPNGDGQSADPKNYARPQP